nr:conotoxin precursor I2 [Conus ebraeus]
MMFRLTSVRCFLLVIVLLNLAVLTDAYRRKECSTNGDCDSTFAVCCNGVCVSNCEERRRRQVPLKLFGQR